jgi:hypothetical protein
MQDIASFAEDSIFYALADNNVHSYDVSVCDKYNSGVFCKSRLCC